MAGVVLMIRSMNNPSTILAIGSRRDALHLKKILWEERKTMLTDFTDKAVYRRQPVLQNYH